MPPEHSVLDVLGLSITFRPGADMDRAAKAASLVEERFEAQRLKTSGIQGKEMALIFLALGLADELLQMKNLQQEDLAAVWALCEKMEKSL